MSDFRYQTALAAAHTHALEWLGSLHTRPLPSRLDEAAVAASLGELPDGPEDVATTIDLLAERMEPGLAGMGSGRFFGFVIGGAHPAALAADWLVSAWDQNAAMRVTTPATAAAERTAGRWILDLLGLPSGSSVGFATGATMANFVGILAARGELLRQLGWDMDQGLAGSPQIRVLAGAEVHLSPGAALRYAGLPQPELVAADAQSRMIPAALEAALVAAPTQPTLVLLQAGDIHSGDSDPFAELIPLAHRCGAWVHVDGAIGLWQAASPSLRHLVAGVELADSWTTDAHKTLNVPYDCGLIIVRDERAHRAATAMHGPYIDDFNDGLGQPFDYVPEMSRRARGVPVWAVLRSLGRSGVAKLVDRMVLRAREIAAGIAAIPGAVLLNDVVFTQASIAFESDERTRRIVAAILDEGEVWMSGSQWHGRAVLRISVSNWQTNEDDVERAVAAVARAVARVELGVSPPRHPANPLMSAT